MKQWLNRLIACLCAALLLTLPGTAAYAAEEIGDAELELLQSLDILDGLTDDLLSSQALSRAEFLALAMQLFGYGDTVVSEAVFADVRPDDWAASYIAAAARLGLVSGDGEGRFRPREQIQSIEALKILVCALGYENEARAMGGYPQGYLAAGANIGLLKGTSVRSGEALTPKQALKLIYNATEVSVTSIVGIVGGEADYTREERQTVLTQCHSIYNDKGIIAQNGRTALTVAGKLPMNKVVIDGVQYDVGKTDAADLLGYRVQYYYRLDADSDERTLLYIKPWKTVVTSICSEDNWSYSAHEYSYETPDGSQEQAQISAQTDVIYNGRAAASYSEEMLLPDYGAVRLIDNNSDGVAEVAFVSDYEVAVVQSVSTDANEIYCKYTGRTLSLDDYEQYRLLDGSGKDVGLSSLREFTVLLVMESTDRQSADILVSNEMVSGTVAEKESEQRQYTINGESYKAGTFFIDTAGGGTVSAGTNASFYVDANGNIQAFGGAQDELRRYGYLVDVGTSRQPGRFGEQVALKILTENGAFATLCLSEQKLSLDGAAATHAEILAALTNGGDARRQVVGYRLNADGDITEIDIPGDWRSNDDALHIKQSAPSGRYKKKPNVISGVIGFTADATVFMVPSGSSDNEKDFSVASITTLANDTEMPSGYVAYGTDADSPLASILVAYDQVSGAGIEKQSNFAVIKHIGEGISQSGEEVKSLEVMYGGKLTRYMCRSGDVMEEIYSYSAKLGSYELGEGDAVRLAINSDNEITRIELHYDKSAGKMLLSANPTGGYTGAPGFMLMHAYDKADDMIICSFEEPEEGMTALTDTLYYFKVPTFDVVVYDETLKDKVKAGSIADIKDYMHFGAYSTLYISTWYGEGLSMVVYR